MRTRPMYLAALLLALAGLAAYLVVPPMLGRQHRAAKAEAVRLGEAMTAPAGATELGVRDCHGDVMRRCFTSTRTPDAVTADVVAALARVAGRAPGTECVSDVTPLGTAVRSCTVRLSTGRGHGVVAFVDTAVRRDPKDRTREVVRGSDVSYTAN